MKFHTRFNPYKDKGLSFESPTLCQTQYKNSCDVNVLIRKALTGDMSVFGSPKFLNVLNAPESFMEAESRIAFAKSVWNDLPEQVKCTYGSPAALLREFDRKQKEYLDKKSSLPKIGDHVPVNGEFKKVGVTAQAAKPSNGKDGVTAQAAEPSNGSAPVST